MWGYVDPRNDLAKRTRRHAKTADALLSTGLRTTLSSAGLSRRMSSRRHACTGRGSRTPAPCVVELRCGGREDQDLALCRRNSMQPIQPQLCWAITP